MPKKRKFNPTVPHCPDPERYTLVKGKYRYFWRLKRGTIKPAVLNDVFQRSAEITHTANQAAKHMMALLSVYTQRMSLGRTTTRVAGAFKKSYLKSGKMDFSYLPSINFQEDYDIYKLFKGVVRKEVVKGALLLDVQVGSDAVAKYSKRTESYQLTAIMLYGDPMKERGIRIETDESPVFLFSDERRLFDCRLSLVLPTKKRTYAVLLHLACRLDRNAAGGSRYHALWVEATG